MEAQARLRRRKKDLRRQFSCSRSKILALDLSCAFKSPEIFTLKLWFAAKVSSEPSSITDNSRRMSSMEVSRSEINFACLWMMVLWLSVIWISKSLLSFNSRATLESPGALKEDLLCRPLLLLLKLDFSAITEKTVHLMRKGRWSAKGYNLIWNLPERWRGQNWNWPVCTLALPRSKLDRQKSWNEPRACSTSHAKIGYTVSYPKQSRKEKP